MFTDLIVLILTMIGLYRVPGRSSLWKMVFQQGTPPLDLLSCFRSLTLICDAAHNTGLIYFMVAFLANLSVVVLLLLDLNPVMNLILAIPAIACTSTVACRCFVSLSTFTRCSDTPETQTLESTWANGLAWFRRSFAHKRRDKDKEMLGHVSTVQWVHTIQDPDALENGIGYGNGRMTTFDAPSDTAVLASRPEAQQQAARSSAEIDLSDLRYVSVRPKKKVIFLA